jgi:hypothetical protein
MVAYSIERPREERRMDETWWMNPGQEKRYKEIAAREAVLIPEHLRHGAKALKAPLSTQDAAAWKAIRQEISALEAELRESRKLNPMLPENIVKQYGPT